MNIWVLTKAYNDYNQYGDYFVAAFASKPTAAQLEEYGIPTERIDLVLRGGGREGIENSWYYLIEEEAR